MDLISDLLKTLQTGNHKFRPTEIYNEGWLLRILLNEYSKHPKIESPLKFHPGANWYSEAMLPTRFKARYQGDKKAESRTNVDGVIGHILVGEKGKADLELTDNATQLTVVEAKMNSPLSKGTTNAPGFDQAARTVACIAETLTNDQNKSLQKVDHTSFVLIAPEEEIKTGKFLVEMDKEKILGKVKARVENYENPNPKSCWTDYENWFNECFMPVYDSIDITTISYESAINELANTESFESLWDFYNKCKDYN